MNTLHDSSPPHAALLDAALHHASTHADAGSPLATASPGLMVVRATAPSALMHDVHRPLACLVLQCGKRVSAGSRVFDFSAGDSLLVTTDIPTVNQITDASAPTPYCSLVIALDPAAIADLVAQMALPASSDQAPLRVDPTESETLDAALRLMQLLQCPQALPALQAQLMREMHYWLLAGRHGDAIRKLGWPEGKVQRVARSVTSMTPLQFQKQLRLIEARGLMRSHGATASSSVWSVGYESVPQLTREYGRLFGLPPAADARGWLRTSASGHSAPLTDRAG